MPCLILPRFQPGVCGAVLAFLSVFSASQAQSIGKPVAPAPGVRTVEFDTDEGTYMCVDVSPDGKTLLFDLLGDLYTMPIEGGRGTPLLSGRPWDRCPRYSPDGKRVAFISDRGNVDNVWVLDI